MEQLLDPQQKINLSASHDLQQQYDDHHTHKINFRSSVDLDLAQQVSLKPRKIVSSKFKMSDPRSLQYKSSSSLINSQKIQMPVDMAVVVPYLDSKIRERNVNFKLSTKKDINIQKLMRQSSNARSQESFKPKPPQLLIQRPNTNYKNRNQTSQKDLMVKQKIQPQQPQTTQQYYGYPRLRSSSLHSTGKQIQQSNVYYPPPPQPRSLNTSSAKALPQQAVNDPNLCLQMNAKQLQLKSLYEHYERQYQKNQEPEVVYQNQDTQTLQEFENELISKHQTQKFVNVTRRGSSNHAQVVRRPQSNNGVTTLGFHSRLESIQNCQPVVPNAVQHTRPSIAPSENTIGTVKLVLSKHPGDNKSEEELTLIRSHRRPNTQGGHKKNTRQVGHKVNTANLRQSGSLSPGGQRSNTSPDLKIAKSKGVYVLNKDIDHVSIGRDPHTEKVKDEDDDLILHQDTEDLQPVHLTQRMDPQCQEFTMGDSGHLRSSFHKGGTIQIVKPIATQGTKLNRYQLQRKEPTQITAIRKQK